MSESETLSSSPEVGRANASESETVMKAGETEIDTLSRMLAGLSRDELRDLHGLVHSRPAFARHVSRVLGAALRQARDEPDLREAIAPVVADGVLATAQREPARLGQAIAPALMPAVRRMIVLSITEMTENIETLMRDAFSVQGLKWRIESIRTGRPVAELVFRDTFQYRVDHVFLSHRSSGVLLSDARRDGAQSKDPGVVASMVAAVAEFVGEAFATGDIDTGERQLRVGDNLVIVEALGELAIAAVVRGSPPSALRQTLRRQLETISETHAPALVGFSGEIEPFADTEPLLQECLRSEFRANAVNKPEVANKGTTGRFVLASVLGVALTWFAYSSWQSHRELGAWQALISDLDAMPGWVLVAADLADPIHDNRPVIRMLADNAAGDPRRLPSAARFADITWKIEAIRSEDPQIILKRAYATLSPPAGVSLVFEAGTLRPVGVADASFVERLETLAIAGVDRVDRSVLYVR